MSKNIIGSNNHVKGHSQDVQRRDDIHFQAEVDSLISKAEEGRQRNMQDYRRRHFITVMISLTSILAGGAGFGWFFLVEYQILPAILCISAGIILPVLLHFWSVKPLKDYTDNYKSGFMPHLAKAMGGLKFFPERGISEKIIGRTGILPLYDRYEAEDCFMGRYKGVKVIFSEALLFNAKGNKDPVFEGILVLLEVPDGIIEGHTIITADRGKMNKWSKTRWKHLKPVPVKTGNPEWDRFYVFSDTPDEASLFIGEKFLKELAEASEIFDSAPVSAALFGGKYVFMAIPCEEDMFEPSNIFVPVATRQHAMNCKREIERIMEIIDVFELYKSSHGASIPARK